MDALEAAQFASMLAGFYGGLAKQVDDYLGANIGKIDPGQEQDLSDKLNLLLAYSNKFADLSDGIAFAGADDYFQKVKDATGQITDSLDHIGKVDKLINISAGLVGLGEGIVTKNGGGILSSLQAIAQSIKA
jgi:hypothetical protein